MATPGATTAPSVATTRASRTSRNARRFIWGLLRPGRSVLAEHVSCTTLTPTTTDPYTGAPVETSGGTPSEHARRTPTSALHGARLRLPWNSVQTGQPGV